MRLTHFRLLITERSCLSAELNTKKQKNTWRIFIQLCGGVGGCAEEGAEEGAITCGEQIRTLSLMSQDIKGSLAEVCGRFSLNIHFLST